jgi:hypothetical protein
MQRGIDARFNIRLSTSGGHLGIHRLSPRRELGAEFLGDVWHLLGQISFLAEVVCEIVQLDAMTGSSAKAISLTRCRRGLANEPNQQWITECHGGRRGANLHRCQQRTQSVKRKGHERNMFSGEIPSHVPNTS